jgi:hypothetical protein
LEAGKGIPSRGAGRRKEDPSAQDIAAATAFCEIAMADRRKKRILVLTSDCGEISSVGLILVLTSELWGTVGDEHFSFAITFEELLRVMICQTNYTKLLELLLEHFLKKSSKAR